MLAAANVRCWRATRCEEVKGDEYARKLVIARTGEQHRSSKPTPSSSSWTWSRSPSIVADLVELDAMRPHQGRRPQPHDRAEAIFAAGDVTDVFSEQVLISVGEGAKAALAAYEYLLEHPTEAFPLEPCSAWGPGSVKKGVGLAPTPCHLGDLGLGELDEQHPIPGVTSSTVAPPGGAIP